MQDEPSMAHLQDQTMGEDDEKLPPIGFFKEA